MLHGYGAAGGAYKRGRSAGRSGPSATKNAAQEGGGKAQFSLKRTKDGRPYVDVDVDQHLFDGLTTAQMQEKAKNIIKDRFKGKVIGADYTALSGIFAARAPARRTLQFRECCGLPMVNRYHGTLTPPRIAPSRPFKEKTEVSLYPASASSQAAAPHDCYSSPEVAHSLSGGLGVGS